MPLPTAVIVVGSDGTIRFGNEAAAEIAGTSVEELLGDQLFVRFPADPPGPVGGLGRALASGGPFYFSTTSPRPDGTDLRTSFRVDPVARTDAPSPTAAAILVQIASEEIAREAPSATTSEEERFRATYAHTSLSYADARTLFEEFDGLMRDQRLYLDKDLDLETVCRRLRTNQLYLSQVVNFFARESFRDNVNRRRVAYLEGLPADEREDCGIGDLWRLAGFGSYSAFRRFLHASRGLTPGEFLRGLRSPVRLQVEQ